jgi:hypothetical protein
MNNIKNIEEIPQIAETFGVVLPDTAKQLDFQGSTNFSWYRTCFGSMTVLTIEHAALTIEHAARLNDNHGDVYVSFICKAPQLHELISALPKQHALFAQIVTWHSSNADNLAEFWAKCYIDLKSKGVI